MASVPTKGSTCLFRVVSITAAVALVCLSTFAWGAADVSEDEKAVVTLTKDNFETFIENDVVLVEFYAPWCGHCKKLAPEFEKAAQQLKLEGSAVKLGQVDATQETELADKYGVRGYPTLQLFRKKTPEEYSGGRTADTIVEWINKMTGAAVSELDAVELGKLKETKPAVVFAGMLKKKESDLHKLFEKAADAHRHVGRFVTSFSDDHADNIVVIRGDEEEVPFTGKTEEELKAFVNEESFALFGPINGENFKNYAERSQELIWFCGEEKDFSAIKSPVRDAAKKYRSEYSFVWLDTEHFRGHAENALGVTEFPALVYQSKKGRFLMPDATHMQDGEKIVSFLEDVKSGKIEKSLKSEPLPASNDAPVKVVVGKNFEDLVLQKDKDVLLEVYAPWCGHCKKLEPVYTELAEALTKVEHVVIAKMDGTANEAPVEDFDWTGFPTLFFVKAGNPSPMKFDGGRTMEGMMEYIKKHSSKGISEEDVKQSPAAEQLATDAPAAAPPAAGGKEEEL
eukprot:GHVS01108109.1.p1 GENE.GHVS01108109.1~~GHVS01108109.1.p1  ORF type:complete len:511 (+),score=132.79 GHVS01108109.1:218-1750(+)